ncbi:Trx7/PDZ domain-containing (seleno)protein [Schlesneria paludicola]|uniref:Trx7/PDZ domain-containing (seleno)protein n=1 Tax=Schlesneria paludicola TaxID=360056 RepID=UPI00029A846D|nr:Trx7/PDZ domain-containing (seleno)protein [Schlesneria paludicola]
MCNRSVSCVMLLLVIAGQAIAEDSLRTRLNDTHADQADVWVYNDLRQGMADAKKQNKPLFVTFRCVPCKDCAAFDADVANGNQAVLKLARDRFVSVRQVEMKGVDLSLFQFDYDLNWAGIFLNPDGVIYARYGTQSSEGADAYNSIDGLLATMNRVLELHANYPENREELDDKRGPVKPIASALELPGLRNRPKYAEQTTKQNCIHCHNIHDAEHQQALDEGRYSWKMMWKYPLPERIGVKIDRRDGVKITEVVAGSAAATAGLVVGEDIVRMEGQRVTSIADIQWVLHHRPGTATQVIVETNRSGSHTLKLADDWKRDDFSWRASMWNAPPRFQAWAPALPDAGRAKLGIPESDSALEVRWINRPSAGGLQAVADGLRENDVIVGVGGKTLRWNTRQFNAGLKQEYRVGDVLPLTVLRDGRREELMIKLVE